MRTLHGYRYATVRCSAFSYSGDLVSVSRGQHDIKLSFDGGGIEQLLPDTLNKRLYDQRVLKITPTEEEGFPRLTYRITETDPNTLQLIDGIYGRDIFSSDVFNPTGTGFTLITDTLTVSINSGGTLDYHAASVQKIGSQYYLYYAPP